MERPNRMKPFYRYFLKIATLLTIASVISACSLNTTKPVVTVIEKTVMVVVTATNPPASATPAATATTAATTTAAAATAVPSATTVSSATLVPATPTITQTAKPTITLTRTYSPPPTLVPLATISVPGAINGEFRYLPTASIEMKGEYVPYLVTGGPVVTKVTYQVYRGSDLVFTSSMTKGPWCLYGASGSGCSPLIFDDYVNTWPLTHISVVSGAHNIHLTIQDNESPSKSWSIDVPITVKLQ